MDWYKLIKSGVVNNLNFLKSVFFYSDSWKLFQKLPKKFFFVYGERAKKVVSDSPGLVDFAIGLVIFVLNLPDGQVVFFGDSNYTRFVINPANQKVFYGLVEMTCGLVHANYSLPEWQAVKLTFFAPWLTGKNAEARNSWSKCMELVW